MSSNKQKILSNIDDLIHATKNRIDKCQQTASVDWTTHEIWKSAVINCVELVSGPNSRLVHDFQAIQFFGGQTLSPSENLITYVVGLNVTSQKLIALHYTLNQWLPEENLPLIKSTQAVAFIAHGGEKSKHCLQKLKEFLLALGVTPIIVEEQSSLNLSSQQKVKYYMSRCNCGIALITAEDIVNTGEKRGKPNIDNEIGMMTNENSINNRIIILRQDGVTLPSNYSELIYASFTKKSMDQAFTQIIKELKGFSLI